MFYRYSPPTEAGETFTAFHVLLLFATYGGRRDVNLTENWVPFIIDRFEKTGKKIDEKEAGRITSLCECHPYYVQQLAHQAWLRTKTRCWEDTIDEAFDDLVRQLSLLIHTMNDDLTQTQTNFLKALLNKEIQMSSWDVLRDYKLGTSANVIRIRESLTAKEIIDVRESKIEFLDPAYKYWLRNYYFGMSTDAKSIR